MKIAILSDLHIEFDREYVSNPKRRKIRKSKLRRALEAVGHPVLGPNYDDLVEIGPKSDVTCAADAVILAGDIDLGGLSADYAGGLADWLGVPVILIAGNHEFYGGEYHSTYEKLRIRSDGYPRLTFLERERFDLEVAGERVRILGCTLWTDFLLFGEGRHVSSMRSAEKSMSDYSGLIQFEETERFLPEQVAIIFAETLQWLRTELATEFRGRTIVVTHHAPSALSVRQDHKRELLSAAYASKLDDLILKAAPALWIHGHMHHSLNYRIGNTRVVCNPRGYRPSELNKKFQPGLLFEI